jgi:hypothetical protein
MESQTRSLTANLPDQLKPQNTSNFFQSVNCDDNLKINEIKSTEHPKPCLNPLLPQPPFLMGVVAPRRSGKTNMTVDSLIDKKKFRGVFDEIYIWSQTFKLDNKWKKIKIKEENVFTTWNESLCKQIMDDVEEEVSENSKIHTLFIFDDIIDAKIMNVHRLGCIESVAVRGRHSNISVIIISQQYMALSSPIRNNITNLIVFRIRNLDELRKITKENQESLTSEQFFQIYDFATNDPFNFLHINNQEPHPRLRFRKNWNTLIILDHQSIEQIKR